MRLVSNFTRNKNIKKLTKKVQETSESQLILPYTEVELVSKYGNILSKRGIYIIVLAGETYRIRFINGTTVLDTAPFDTATVT